MHANYVALAIVAIYIVGLGIVTSIIQRSVKSAITFTTGTTGKTGVPAILVGMMLMSEFIGTSASVGTAQEAYKFGISASWNIIALAAGFVFYGFFLAGKYKSSGHNTISAILDDVYGRPTKLATSLVMIFALEIVASLPDDEKGRAVADFVGPAVLRTAELTETELAAQPEAC